MVLKKSTWIFNNVRNELIKYDLSFDKFLQLSGLDDNIENPGGEKGKIISESDIP